LYLVRHGRAAAGWDTAIDPPLDELGREQAAATAAKLVVRLQDAKWSLFDIDVVTSPALALSPNCSSLRNRNRHYCQR